MPEEKVPSAGNAVVVYFVKRLERTTEEAGEGYVSGESFFPDPIVKAFNQQNNSLTLTPDFFEKLDKKIIMNFWGLKIWVPTDNIVKVLIV